MNIFFANPRAQNLLIKKKILKSLGKVISQNNYILDNENKKFEDNLKRYFGCKYALGVNSGTDALKIAIKSLSLKKKSEIIIPTLTATATGSAVLEAGVKPVIIDVDETGNLNSEILKKSINKNTKAIIVVHLHGNLADIKRIKKIAGNIPIIEDCAQAFGSSFHKKKAGTFGKISCFSFYPTKNLGGIGDGGAIITNDFSAYNKMLQLRQYGWNKKRVSKIPGYNSRLDEIQAAILNLKIKNIDKDNNERIKIAKKYISSFKNLPIEYPEIYKKTKHTYHLFVIKVKNRDKLINYLKLNKIYASIHYKHSLHCMPSFKKYKKSKIFFADDLSKNMISLPLYPGLKMREQNKVIKVIKKYFSLKTKD
jgi:dTDP-4-amino-4,6-dideoxygalactose transaminase